MGEGFDYRGFDYKGNFWVMKIFYILTEVRDGYMKVIKLHTRAKFTACKLCLSFQNYNILSALGLGEDMGHQGLRGAPHGEYF